MSICLTRPEYDEIIAGSIRAIIDPRCVGEILRSQYPKAAEFARLEARYRGARIAVPAGVHLSADEIDRLVERAEQRGRFTEEAQLAADEAMEREDPEMSLLDFRREFGTDPLDVGNVGSYRAAGNPFSV